MTKGKAAAAPARLFKNQNAWAEWLENNHRQGSGIWLRMAKKDSGLQSVSYAEALETALCQGWIDGQKRPGNERTRLQKFVPRSSKSIWSKIIREKARALMESRRMKSAGFKAVEQAKANGRWDAAYDSPSRAEAPADFAAALERSAKAKRFFAELDRANRYAILFRLQTAKKAETRARKIEQFIARLERHETIHPRNLKRSAK
jgi:uncharacterized protein YdeI (YjbR/CyaY-like superfamily)